MKLDAFRITDYRSIVDTEWCRLSRDNVTVLVGQNESGKSSILEALWKTFGNEPLTGDELRFGAPLPKTYLRISTDITELEAALGGIADKERRVMERYLADHHGQVILTFGWRTGSDGYSGTCDFEDDALSNALAEVSSREETQIEPQSDDDDHLEDDDDHPAKPPLSPKAVAIALYESGPEMVLFKQGEGLLPNSIDIVSDGTLAQEGRLAAQNYLTVAGIDLKELLAFDLRARENYLQRANSKLTRDFNRFWTQVIGRNTPLEIGCQLQHHPAGRGPGGRGGLPYLTFWISDAQTRLYPSQRSAGVRWFVSFYLQLKATERLGKKRIFLLDEPGANLHSRAQEDVLRLVNELSASIPIIYSTHSQDMIEFEKLYRVRAVQRDAQNEESPTRVFEAEHLAAASSDTLTPVLNAIGVNLHKQQVIPKRGTVLLEEPSAQHYLRAFWMLTGTTRVVYFIAATGAGKIPQLALMFTGWGLEFGVVLDDDSRGRTVFNELKRDLYGDDDIIARHNMLKISECQGIEDIFSPADFHKYVADEFDPGAGDSPSKWAKSAGRSKPVLAYQFFAKVKRQTVDFSGLEPDTRERIARLVAQISNLDAIAPKC
jgi:hypothetical protein